MTCITSKIIFQQIFLKPACRFSAAALFSSVWFVFFVLDIQHYLSFCIIKNKEKSVQLESVVCNFKAFHWLYLKKVSLALVHAKFSML